MDCPICKNEMIEGFIPQYKHSMFWHPKTKVKGYFNVLPVEGRVMLSEMPFLKVEKVVSFICKPCKIVITPIKEFNYSDSKWLYVEPKKEEKTVKKESVKEDVYKDDEDRYKYDWE